MSGPLKAGDLVRGKFFRGEKPLTYVGGDGVMVQITPVYEQAYMPDQVSRDPQPWEYQDGERWADPSLHDDEKPQWAPRRFEFDGIPTQTGSETQ